jgi:phosphonate transport system substrate-binding protein
MRTILSLLAAAALSLSGPVVAAPDVLQLGIGLFQPDKEKNDATYRPLADYLAKRLGKKIVLRTVDTWEGLAKSLASGETDLALMGPWGYVLANNESGAQAVATILYEGRPEYFAIIVTHPRSGINRIEDLKGRSFAFGDKGSTSGYLIPLHELMKRGIPDPEKHFGRTLYTRHQAIEAQVTRGELDAGADYNRNRDAMIADGLIKAGDSRIIWTSAPLPNDAFAVSAALAKDKAFVEILQRALEEVGKELESNPQLLPARYTGFVKRDNAFYAPIREAGLATGKLKPRR